MIMSSRSILAAEMGGAAVGGTRRWPLHAAAARGDATEVGRLLAAGHLPNEYNDRGDTPLTAALDLAGHNCCAVVRTLIRHRADANLPRSMSAAGAGKAVASNEPKLGQALQPTPLHLAAARGRTDCAAELLGAGAQAKILAPWPVRTLGEAAGAPSDLVTCLHVAAVAGHAEFVRWICASRPTLAQCRSRDDWTVIHMVSVVLISRVLLPERGEISL